MYAQVKGEGLKLSDPEKWLQAKGDVNHDGSVSVFPRMGRFQINRFIPF